MKTPLYYLATPYTHPEHYMMVARHFMVNKVGAKLIQEGKYIYSPISHTHPIAEVGELPRGWDFWEGYDRVMLQACTNLIVLRLPGWEESTGVRAEIKIAKELGLPTEYIDYDLKPDYDSMVSWALNYYRAFDTNINIKN